MAKRTRPSAFQGPTGEWRLEALRVRAYWLAGRRDATEFVNADVIALGLSGFDPARAAISAGKIMLRRARQLAQSREDFAIETTLAGRLLAPWIRSLLGEGCSFHLVFLWLSSAELAVGRVAERVRSGGHDVPEAAVRRRYEAGLRNFFHLYRPLATAWRFYDNSGQARSRLIATGHGTDARTIHDEPLWSKIEKEYRHV